MEHFFTLLIILLSATAMTIAVLPAQTSPITSIQRSGKQAGFNPKAILLRQHKIYEQFNSISINNLDRLQTGMHVLQTAKWRRDDEHSNALPQEWI